MLLHLDGNGPRYAQITRALTAEIQSGALAPGARVPATRELARDLGCSRNIVLLAYEQLVLEGYLVTRAGGGTFVSPELPVPRAADAGAGEPADEPAVSPLLSAEGRRILEIGARARRVMPRMRWPRYDFMFGMCEPDDRAIARIRAAFGATLRDRPFNLANPAGDRDLRQQVADRLRGVRGITRAPEHIVITGGVQQALEVCARLLITPGDRVVVEDPGYEVPPAIFEVSGAEVVRVPVDRQGLDVDALPDEGRPVRLVYVTPSHQFPTGAVMPVGRRHALLAWAARVGAIIIEDDYDGEFRYAGRPVKALAALDADAPVIYCGTFSKSFFPALRLGYLVLPPHLAPPAMELRWLSDRGGSILLQRTVGHLMATGEYDRHIRRMHRRYRARRAALVEGLRKHFGRLAEIEGSEAGLHLTVWLPDLPATRMDALLDACDERRVGAYSVARYAALPLRRQGLLLGYGMIDVPDIRRGVRYLADAYREVMRPSHLPSPPERGRGLG